MISGKIILETPRLYLREFVPEDAGALALVISDAETMRHYPSAYDRAGVEEWIARNRRRYAQNGHGLWAMLLKSTGELIGDCGQPCNWRMEWGNSRLATICAAISGVTAMRRKPRERAAIGRLPTAAWIA